MSEREYKVQARFSFKDGSPEERVDYPDFFTAWAAIADRRAGDENVLGVLIDTNPKE